MNGDALEVQADAGVQPADVAQVEAPTTGHHEVRPAPGPAAGKPACGAPVARTGKPCTLAPVAGQRRCFQHSEDPATLALVKASRRQGGLVQRSTAYGIGELAADLSTPEGVQRVLATVADAVAAGRLTAAAGATVASLARVAVEAAKARVEAQLEELSRQLEAQLGGRR